MRGVSQLTRRPQLEGPDWDAAVARWAAAFGARHRCWGDSTPHGAHALAAAEAAGADWDVRTELRERRESNTAVFEAARREGSDSPSRKGSRRDDEDSGRGRRRSVERERERAAAAADAASASD